MAITNKRKRPVLRTSQAVDGPEPERRLWMTRGLREDHHARLKKIAAFIGARATVREAHDRVLAAGLPVVEREVGLPAGPEPAIEGERD